MPVQRMKVKYVVFNDSCKKLIRYHHRCKLCQKSGGAHRRARAYNGSLGAEPPVGFRGRAPGQVLTLPAWSWKHFCLSEVHKHKFAHFCYHGNCSNMLLKRILLNFCHQYRTLPHGPVLSSVKSVCVYASVILLCMEPICSSLVAYSWTWCAATANMTGVIHTRT